MLRELYNIIVLIYIYNINMDNKIYIKYDDVHQIIKNKSDAIIKFNPDIIIAIGGGGLIPGRIVRTFVDVPLLVVTLKLYNLSNNIQKVSVIQWLDDNNIKKLKNKRILLVDEVDDTRTTLLYCIDKLQKYDPEKIGVFVIHNKLKKKKNKY